MFTANKEMEEQNQENTRKFTELLAERGKIVFELLQ